MKEEFRQVQEQMIQQRNLEGRRSSLQAQVRELEKRLLELSWQKESEQRDVEKLEGRSLSNLFYYLTGSITERQNKEKREAYEAAVRYEVAEQELEAVRRDLDQISRALSEVRDAGRRYEELLAERREELKESGSEAGEELLELEEQIASGKAQLKELEEAKAAGREAIAIAEAVLMDLTKAENYGTWDMLGGGMLAGMGKHNNLDSAQRKVEQLQIRLRRFQTELSDVQIHTDMQVNVEGFVRFADYFFDGLFVDWSVQNQIGGSKKQVGAVVQQVKTILSRLEGLERAEESRQRSKMAQLNELVRKSIEGEAL